MGTKVTGHRNTNREILPHADGEVYAGVKLTPPTNDANDVLQKVTTTDPAEAKRYLRWADQVLGPADENQADEDNQAA